MENLTVKIDNLLERLRALANKIQHLYIHPNIDGIEMTQSSTALSVAAQICYEYSDIESISDDELFAIARERFQIAHDNEIAIHQEFSGMHEQRNNRKTANRKSEALVLSQGVSHDSYAQSYFDEMQWRATQDYLQTKRIEEI